MQAKKGKAKPAAATARADGPAEAFGIKNDGYLHQSKHSNKHSKWARNQYESNRT